MSGLSYRTSAAEDLRNALIVDAASAVSGRLDSEGSISVRWKSHPENGRIGRLVLSEMRVIRVCLVGQEGRRLASRFFGRFTATVCLGSHPSVRRANGAGL